MSPSHFLQVVFLATVAILGSNHGLSAADDKPFEFQLRYRTETAKGSGRYHTLSRPEKWSPRETAVIVCDMWDLHHCLNATRRGGELAPRMDKVLTTARKHGATIIHAPSSCMDAYKSHAARKRAASIARSENLPDEIGKWCYKIPAEERGKYPIDQTDGGEDDDPEEHAAWAAKLKAMGRNPRAPWKSQTDGLTIEDEDFISDNGEEIWSILESRGIQNVILLGVHTNMCVLGRPFGLRQMSKNGKNVVLMRDMTDTMYNPKRAPYVSHFTGTDLIVAHIEKFVCPTITSDQLLGGKPFRFKHDKRKRLVIVMAEREYRTNESLPKFALEHLGHDFSVRYVHADPKDRNNLPGIEVLEDADMAFFSVRRRVPPADQMAVIRKFVESGKPVAGIRTASHAFTLRNQPPPAGHGHWPEFDRDVLGGNYHNHHGNGPKVKITVADSGKDHPVLKGVDAGKFVGNGSLYLTKPLQQNTTLLLSGTIPKKETEPVAWVNERPGGQRVFYTALGHIDDFNQPHFNRMLKNGLLWAANVDSHPQ